MSWPSVFPTRSESRTKIQEAIVTGEGRSKLVSSMVGPARHKLDFIQVKYRAGKRTKSEAASAVRPWLEGIEYVLERADGTEVYDKTAVSCLMGDIRVFLAELA